MRIAKGIVVSDTHLGEHNIYLLYSIFKQLIAICKEKNINTIYHTGDWFIDRKGQTQEVLLATKTIINLIRQNGLRIFIIPGNHDKTDLNSSESFLDIFDEEGVFDVIPNYTQFEISDKLVGHFIPYYKETESYPMLLNQAQEEFERLYERDQDQKHILFTHIAVNGVTKNSGLKEEHSLHQDRFSIFNKVLIGHYHNQQQFNNFYYIGSSHQANFGEDEYKGCHVLYDDGSLDFIQLEFPQYRKIEIEVEKIDNQFIEFIKQIKETSPKDIVRVVITGDKTKIQGCDFITRLQEVGVDVKKVDEELQLDIENAKSETMFVYESTHLMEAFIDFTQKSEIENNEYGIKILNQLFDSNV